MAIQFRFLGFRVGWETSWGMGNWRVVRVVRDQGDQWLIATDKFTLE
jgi:hypothetical protein